MKSHFDLVARHIMFRAIPRLKELPPTKQDAVIKSIDSTSFDAVEKIWIIVGVAFVAYILRVYSIQGAATTVPVFYLMQFLEAIPLLFVIVGPVYLRRARRVIDLEIERLQQAKT